VVAPILGISGKIAVEASTGSKRWHCGSIFFDQHDVFVSQQHKKRTITMQFYLIYFSSLSLLLITGWNIALFL